MMKIIVIGAGPGGYETALEAARRGIEVILVESSEVGGTCLNRGCIPTKTLCRSAQLMEDIRRAGEFGVSVGEVSVDYGKVVERKNEVVKSLRSGVESLLGHKLITLVKGRAIIKGPQTVAVEIAPSNAPGGISCDGEPDLQTEEYSADYIIVATGSSSAALNVPGANMPGVLSSDDVLELTQLPGSICIIGAGVIGLELASVLSSFGVKVTVLEYCKGILPRFDSDIAKRLKQSLVKRGIEINTQTAVRAIDECDEGLSVSYEQGGAVGRIVAEKVLMAVGRRPNVDGLGLENAGIAFSNKGIEVDENMRTTCPTVFAIGDVNGRMMLAHAAVYQGRKALNKICGADDLIDLSIVPSAVFTIPEAATVGMTEEECKSKGIAFRCLKAFYRANGKAVCSGEPDGFCKLIVSDSSDMNGNALNDNTLNGNASGDSSLGKSRVLGCHLYGLHASDLVHEVCILMNEKASIEDFRDMIHAHPTLGEILQSAAWTSFK